MGQIPEVSYTPPSREEIFVARLDKAIKFHENNHNDPHGISVAVICALTEVRIAYAGAFRLPDFNKARSV